MALWVLATDVLVDYERSDVIRSSDFFTRTRVEERVSNLVRTIQLELFMTCDSMTCDVCDI